MAYADAPSPTRAGVLGITRTIRPFAPNPSSIAAIVTPAATETTRCSAVTAGRSSWNTSRMFCGLTARTSTSLSRATSRFESKMPMPVSDCKAVRAAGSGSLAQIASVGASPARIIPLIKAVAIFPEPMKPQRVMLLDDLS